jgi:hypothetical protein
MRKTPYTMDPEQWRLQGLLKEAVEHLDKLELLLHRCNCSELDEEFDEIRAVIKEIGK